MNEQEFIKNIHTLLIECVKEAFHAGSFYDSGMEMDDETAQELINKVKVNLYR